jgi:hypothetical protein
MTPRGLKSGAGAAFATTASLALAACGGSTAGPTTVVVVEPQANPPTTVASSSAPTSAARASSVAKRPPVSDRLAGLSSEARAKAIKENLPPGAHRIDKVAQSPVPGSGVVIGCLGGSGLVHVGPRQLGVWAGASPVSGKDVYVDGPYKTTQLADQSVSTLVQFETAASGGHFVVSAIKRDQLDATVKAVATCLAARS